MRTPARRLRLRSVRTQRSLVFILGGVVVGGAAVALALLADQAQDLFMRFIQRWPYGSLLVTPMGLAIAAQGGAEHPLALKYRLHAGGRWLLGVMGERCYLF